ncbi:putative sensor histidine kinase pdtaS [Mycobacterium xenopi 3993]|nr:putative sensor histidine kinase pdtaS [Mycobacterium xenopi 3993]
MLSEGTFPNVGDVAMARSSPRAGDGFIRLDNDGVVSYASPNALSAYHRMGLTSELEGHNLIEVTRPLISDPFEAHELAEHVRDSLAGGASMRIEVDAGGATVLLRTLPLVVHGSAAGAAVLIRDVTEVKRRDRALMSKDATIREIHHRVKNNLQTVAALLRLQARRTTNPEGREALLESVRRVSSIALVHDALSMSVDEQVNLDEVIDRILPIMNDVASVDTPIRVNRVGALGVLDSDRATALIMVITELVQNAIEHAFDPEAAQGCVTIHAERSARWLDVVVHDNGRACRMGSAWKRRIGWACRSCGRWCRRSLTARCTCRPRPLGALRWCCGSRLVGAPGRRNSSHAVLRPRQIVEAAIPETPSDSGACFRPGVAALERAPLVFTHSAPHARVLASFQRPGETLCGHRAPATDQFRVSDLRECRPAVPHRKEQLRVLVATDRLVAPIHTLLLLTMCAAVRTGVFLRLLTRAQECFRTVARDRLIVS